MLYTNKNTGAVTQDDVETMFAWLCDAMGAEYTDEPVDRPYLMLTGNNIKGQLTDFIQVDFILPETTQEMYNAIKLMYNAAYFGHGKNTRPSKFSKETMPF